MLIGAIKAVFIQNLWDNYLFFFVTGAKHLVNTTIFTEPQLKIQLGGGVSNLSYRQSLYKHKQLTLSYQPTNYQILNEIDPPP